MANLLYLINSVANEVYLKRDVLSVSSFGDLSSNPARYAVELPVSKPWRPAPNTNEAAFLEIDFGEPITANFCAVVNHRYSPNLGGDPMTFSIRAGATPNPSAFIQAIPKSSRFTSYTVFDSAQTYRYWRLRISDVGSNISRSRVGYIVLGVAQEWSFRYPHGWTRTDEMLTRTSETELRIPITGEPLVERRRFSLALAGLNATERAEVLAFTRAMRGSHEPFFVVVDPNYDQEGIFGRLDQSEFRYTVQNKGWRDLASLDIVEDNLGFDLRLSE